MNRAPQFWYRSASLKSYFLYPLSLLYGFISFLRFKFKTPFKAPIPVICIGNLTVGGTGKTPVALTVATWLKEQGFNPHFITRGYKGRLKGPILVDPLKHTALDCGDEPLLLARNAPTWVARERKEGALKAYQKGATHLILDDGFQNPTLYKDLSLLVVDEHYAFGNGFMLPAGPLREFMNFGLKRAQGVCIIKGAFKEKQDKSESLIRGLQKQAPHLLFAIASIKSIKQNYEKPLIAFSGIGHPEKFFNYLKNQGYSLLESYSYPDHYFYKEAEIAALKEEAKKRNTFLVTTEKDFVRLSPKDQEGILPFKVSLAFEDESFLKDFLAPVIHTKR